MKKQLLFILLISLTVNTWSQQSVVEQMIAEVKALGGTPEVEVEKGAYARIRLVDSCYVETFLYGDSILLVQTVCAPLCSSVVRMYDSRWELLYIVSAPSTYTLPQAFIEDNGVIHWQENYKEEL